MEGQRRYKKDSNQIIFVSLLKLYLFLETKHTSAMKNTLCGDNNRLDTAVEKIVRFKIQQ